MRTQAMVATLSCAAIWVGACSGASSPGGAFVGSDGGADVTVFDAWHLEIDAGPGDGSAAVQDGSTDGVADVTAWTDDPCPPPGIGYDVNCSDTCPAPMGGCDYSRCGGNTRVVQDWSELPFTMRTPSHPGLDPACTLACGIGGPTIDFGMYFAAILPPAGNTPNIIARVGPPWHIAVGGICTDNTACAIQVINSSELRMIIWTDDPAAPSRNVTITAATPEDTCP